MESINDSEHETKSLLLKKNCIRNLFILNYLSKSIIKSLAFFVPLFIEKVNKILLLFSRVYK